jgi:hypothetical protein
MRRYEYWFRGSMIFETIAKNKESAISKLIQAIKIKEKERV